MLIDKNYVKKLLPESPVICDFGAHHAEDSIEFAKIIPKAKIYAAECDPRAYAKAEQNIKEYPNIRLFNLAIGNECKEVEFHQSSGCPDNWPEKVDWDFSGSVLAPKNHILTHKWCLFSSIIKVEMTSTDAFCRTNGIDHIDYIHLDVQGSEGMVVEGFKSMKDHIHYLYTEFENDEQYEGQPTLRKLRDMLPGWFLIGFYDNNVLFVNNNYKA